MNLIGLSEGLTRRFCSDLFGRVGLVWSQSESEFEEKISHLVEEWDSLERSERQGEPKFSTYFLETRSKI